MSQLLVDDIVDKDGGNSVGFSKGINVGASSTITGNLNVTGVLTYEDVTNVDSVGVVTAREGIRIGAGKSIGSDGSAAVYYGDGSNLTGVANTDNVNTVNLNVISGVSTFNNDVTLTGSSYSVVWDKSDNALEFGDNAYIKVGSNDDLNIYHDGNSYISNAVANQLAIQSDDLKLRSYTGTEKYLTAAVNGAVDLYYNDNKKLETHNTGVKVTGVSTVTGDSFVGSAITMYASSGIVSATSFHGDGSNLSNVSAGGWIPIANSTVTSGSTLCDFPNCFDGTYDHYRIEFTCHFGAIGNTTEDYLRLRQYDSGSLRTSSDYDYSVNYSGNGTGNRSHSTSSGSSSFAYMSGNQDSQAWQGHMDIWNPDLTVIQAAFNFWMNGYWIKQPDGSTNNNRLGVNGVCSACPSDNTPVAVTGFKMYSNASTAFSNGNVVVYGLKTS